MLRSRFGFALLALAIGLHPPAAAQTPDGPEFRINVFTTGVQRPTSVASAADGGFVVVWESNNQDGSGYGIFARQYDATGAPGSEFQVNQFFTSTQSSPAVAAASDGRFVVAWTSFGQDTNDFGVFARRHDPLGTALGAEFRVNSYLVGAQQSPSVAAAANGSFVVTWESTGGQDGQSSGIFGQRYDAVGNRIGAEFRVNVVTTSTQQRARVAAAEDGRFVVVWESFYQDGAGVAVIGRRYDAAGNPGAEFQVNTYTTSVQAYAAVSMAQDGRFVVVWQSYAQDGQFGGIFGQRYDAGGSPQGAEFLVNTYTTSNQQRPAVAMAGDGSFVVTWRSYDGLEGMNNAGVRGRMFDVQGDPVGGEFRVNSYTTGLQGTPLMSSAPNGSFVVVWRSNGQDGSTYGAFGQRYSTTDLIFADGFEL
jgi:hypothetical protein